MFPCTLTRYGREHERRESRSYRTSLEMYARLNPPETEVARSLIRYTTMSESSPTGRGSEQPHLISLVFQSRNALQQGEAFCSRASATSTSSAKEATDVLALNAKIQWISNAVIEQLKARLTCIFFRTSN
jgi:hypothetical protein